jgi:putative toxin-antitoxin system antitoxin component (TIGR02293 family)
MAVYKSQKKTKVLNKTTGKRTKVSLLLVEKNTLHPANVDTGRAFPYGNSSSILLSEAADKPESYMTAMEKMGMLRAGITKKDLESLKQKTELSYDELARALCVTRATLINKKGKEKFNPSLSERIISLADIYSYGYEVFEDKERFNQWMTRPNKALGGRTPMELIDNLYGREEVRNIIGRIDYGVYS